ncbi:MAG: SMP-30/gluconolactonase/LRE family protein [Polyangiaceae bacterium]|nr:SMP-30/gluconolactonase/LRE family protein [Polyangiaceae bacterium]
MNYRRLVFVFAALPIACFAYACSSSSNDNPPEQSTTNDDASVDSSNETPTVDAGDTADATDASDASDAADASDADDADADDKGEPPPPDDKLVSCVGLGNPMKADAEGVVSIDSGDPAVTQIVDEFNDTGYTDTFVGSPLYIEVGGVGQLVFSEFNAVPFDPLDPNTTVASAVFSVNLDGSGRKVFRFVDATRHFSGNALLNNDTVLSVGVTDSATTGFIYQTKTDGTVVDKTFPTDPSIDPRDLVVGPNGDIYFTDPQYQVNNNDNNDDIPISGIYRIPNGGAATAIHTDGDVAQYNGIALSSDAKTLYTSVTSDSTILTWTVSDDGSVADKSTTLVAATADAPDGIAVDTAGNLWIAESDINGDQHGRVEVFSADGKTKYGEITFQDQRPTGVAFGDADNQTLFITTELGIYKYNVRCAGIRK